jgi:hypothetical protein
MFISIREVRTGKEIHRLENEFFGQSAWSPTSRTLYIEHGRLWRLQLQPDLIWKLNKGKSNW